MEGKTGRFRKMQSYCLTEYEKKYNICKKTNTIKKCNYFKHYEGNNGIIRKYKNGKLNGIYKL